MWALIIFWLELQGMLPTSWLYEDPGMHSKVFCTIHDENELECGVDMQNMAPVSMEECEKNGTHFCGTLHLHCLT